MFIKVDTPDGMIEAEGECVKSEHQWSRNVEKRISLRNCDSVTLVPIDCFEEFWELDGYKGEIQLLKIVTEKGTEYSFLSESKSHGGKREGAGRKPTGRSKKNFYLTNDEAIKVKEFVESLRAAE